MRDRRRGGHLDGLQHVASESVRALAEGERADAKQRIADRIGSAATKGEGRQNMLPWVAEFGGVLFVNCGSVGKPKDGDPRAAFAVQVRGAGLPGEYADRLLAAA